MFDIILKGFSRFQYADAAVMAKFNGFLHLFFWIN